jgi:hypothetical protein
MLSLSDRQLQTVMETAANIDPNRRGVYLQRIEARMSPALKFQPRPCHQYNT